MKRQWLLWLVSAGACVAVRNTQLVRDPDAGVTIGPRLSDAAPPSPDAGHLASALCGSRACSCDDGQDNDHDGLMDGLDPECTGAFDDDEATFGIGKPNKQAQCRDCFWDDNAGSGDDGCRYPAECLTGASLSNNGKGNCSSCQVGAQCVNSCQARTPNGCDCFGCCDVVTADASHVFIELSEDCALDRIGDVKACPRCTPNTDCQNTCGRCELCLGKRAVDLPADCTTHACDNGLSVCNTSADCAGSAYCHLGCCLVDLF